MSDLFPRTEVPQVNLTGPARTAAEALVLRDYTVANNFDPTVSGQASAVGSTMRTLDGTKSWVKWGAGNTQWGPLHPVTAALGVTGTTFDTTVAVASLACDTLGGFKAVFQGLVGNSAQYFTLRLNGASFSGRANAICGSTAMAGFSSTNPATFFTQSGAVGANARFTIEIECDSPLSGNRYRILKYHTVFADNEATITQSFGQAINVTMPIAEITSVGISGTSIDATSTVTVTR